MPAGGAGCALHASPDLLTAGIPVAGNVSTSLVVPATASLVGLSLQHQVITLELGPSGITLLTSTNGLALTIGSW